METTGCDGVEINNRVINQLQYGRIKSTFISERETRRYHCKYFHATRDRVKHCLHIYICSPRKGGSIKWSINLPPPRDFEFVYFVAINRVVKLKLARKDNRNRRERFICRRRNLMNCRIG